MGAKCVFVQSTLPRLRLYVRALMRSGQLSVVLKYVLQLKLFTYW